MSNDSPDWTARERAALGRFDPRRTLARELLAPPVALACRAIIQVANRLEIHGGNPLIDIRARAKVEHRGLLTFSNHVSLFDDPWLMACLCRPTWGDLRWIPVDAINFFDNRLSAWFFGVGKGVPIIRGGGVDQPAMTFLTERLQVGDWVHVFPEGTRSRKPTELHLPLKSGLANLIRASRPWLLPFHHKGMEHVLPIGSRLPRAGQKVEVRFGSLLDSREGLADRPLEEITSWAEARLLELQEQSR